MGRRRPIAQSQHITKWNILALLAAIAGAATTLGLDQFWLYNWSRSGVAFPIGQRVSIQLPAGLTRVYYESPVAVPTGDATLRVFDAESERLPVKQPIGDASYRLLFSGWSGRSLWEVDIPAAGTYQIACYNHNYMNDKDIPAEDRVVFLKEPNNFTEVKTVRTFIQVTGATITMTAVIVLYLLHSLALQRRKKLANAGAAPA